MSIVPEFLIKKVYRKGSLKETDEGISFELKNILGSGEITGIGYIQINDTVYESPMIKIITAGLSIVADSISPENPIVLRLNQEGKLLLEGAKGLKDGINNIIMEIMNPEAGKVKVSLTDTVRLSI